MGVVENKKSKSKYTSERYLNTLSGLKFDGVDDYISLGNPNDYASPNGITFSYFINHSYIPPLSSGSNLTWAHISWLLLTGVGDNVSGLRFLSVDVSGTNRIGLALYNDSINTDTYVFYDGIKLDTWYHITFTVNDSEAKLYLNGRLVSTDIMVSPLSTYIALDDLTIGKHRLNNNPSQTPIVQIAHFTVFNKALDQDEVSFIHRWAGRIPESAMANIVEHQPLQYNSFVNDSVFRSREISIIQTI